MRSRMICLLMLAVVLAMTTGISPSAATARTSLSARVNKTVEKTKWMDFKTVCKWKEEDLGPPFHFRVAYDAYCFKPYVLRWTSSIKSVDAIAENMVHSVAHFFRAVLRTN